MHIAVVGATGLVGRKMLEVLDESGLKIDELLPAASEKSAGMELEFQGKKYVIRTIEDVLSEKPDAALFSAGGSVSLEWAPKFAEAGITVIDNSSAFRMDADKPLCVPEINANQLTKNDKIIANPNCSTIQLVMILNPLHKLYGLKRVVVSTYQSITGTGAKAVEQMEAERAGKDEPKIYKYQIDKNCIPQCDVFAEDGYTKEELKVVNETRKILGIPQLGVTCTAVRVPVVGGHSESVNIEFNREPNIDEIRKVLDSEEGISLQDDPDTFCYPMPLTAHNKNEVFVGRIRKDFSQPNTINLWI
ncbi:MAG: aspartate-semialdehyde dehydrogenase, partial [Bacteroidia bacterium]